MAIIALKIVAGCQSVKIVRIAAELGFLLSVGIKKAASEWARITGISSYTIYWWMNTKGDAYAVSRIIEKLGD